MTTATLNVRLYKVQGPDHVAVVSVQPSWTHAGAVLIAIARGSARNKLGQATVHGPFAPDAVQMHVDKIVEDLRAEGFAQPGKQAALAALQSPSARSRALAALRLGWLRETAAVDRLIELAAMNGEDACAMIDALGAIGDPRAIPLLRQESARKLLSRRRSGAEAVRALEDAGGQTEVRMRASARLPQLVQDALGQSGDDDLREDTVSRVASAVAKVPMKDRGLALDTLYDLATPLAVAASKRGLQAVEIVKPHIWRYAKSILKRSMLRHDATMFGWLAHRIERIARTAEGAEAELKSGYDGQTKVTSVFSRRTRIYVQRLTWRYLRRLAQYRPHLYPPTAAEAIVHYDAEDEAEPRGDFGAYAACHLLHRVLWDGGSRYEILDSSLRFRRLSGEPIDPRPGVREESFPDLWDSHPHAYLRLLGASRLITIQEFALRAVLERHSDLLRAASHAEILALLAAPYEPTAEAGRNELLRRFDPTNPDWSLLALLLADEQPSIRAIGIDWLGQTALLWSRDPDRCAKFLVGRNADVRDTVAALCIQGLTGAPPDVRRALATRLLEILQQGEPEPGAHEAVAAVAREALLDELTPLVETSELARWLDTGTPALKSVAAALLVRRNDAPEALGLARIAALAQDEMAALRTAGLGLLARALPRFAEDPSFLLQVAECQWADSRRGAVALLRTIHPDTFTLDAVLEMLDSSSEEVEEFARELLEQKHQHWDPVAVLSRLLEHPRAAMRRFVIDEIQLHLVGDLSRLDSPEDFFRTVLFDLKPGWAVKRKAIELLAQNGERDERMARMAVAVLGSVVRTRTREDFEDALAALARVRLAYPEIEMPAGVVIGEPA